MQRSPFPASGGRALRRTSRLAVAILALALAAGIPLVHETTATARAQPRQGDPPLVQETFTGATAPEFTAVGAACLTGAPQGVPPPAPGQLGGCREGVGPTPPNDAAPFGYLRLTDSSNDQSGAVLYNHPIPANEGLDVTFDQWQYGSTTPNTPADGISFFLTDGSTQLVRPGAFGGSLGYAAKLPDDNPNAEFIPGVDRGYLGVGLDVLGNYFGDWEHRGNGCPPGQRSPAGTSFRVPAPGQNMVTVRGPGDDVEGYCLLTATTSNFTTTGPWPSTLPGNLQGPLTVLPGDVTPQEAQALLEPSRRRVHVVLTPAPNPVLSVSMDFNDGTGFHRVIDTPAPAAVPQTYKFGFAASTGLFTDEHLIRNVVINSEAPLRELNLVKQAVQPLPPDLGPGSTVPYQYVVTNSGNTPIHDLAVVDDRVGVVTCPVRELAPGDTVTCTGIYRVTAADVAAGRITDTAIARGMSDGESVTSPPSTETIPIEGPPRLKVKKRAAIPGPYSVGQTVPFTYTVTNTGGVPLDDITVHDDHVSGIRCERTTLSPGETTICRGSYTVTREDGVVGHVTNTAFVTGITPDGETIDSPDTQQTLQVGAPHLSLRKQVISKGPFQVGSPVRYAYRVTNTGSFPLTDVHVSDDRVATVTCDTTTLFPGESTTCRGTYTITRADIINCLKSRQPQGRGDDWQDGVVCAITNVSQAEGTAPDGTPITSDPAQATVGVEVKKQKEKCPKPPKCEKGKQCPKPPTCGQKPGHDDGITIKLPAKSEEHQPIPKN